MCAPPTAKEGKVPQRADPPPPNGRFSPWIIFPLPAAARGGPQSFEIVLVVAAARRGAQSPPFLPSGAPACRTTKKTPLRFWDSLLLKAKFRDCINANARETSYRGRFSPPSCKKRKSSRNATERVRSAFATDEVPKDGVPAGGVDHGSACKAKQEPHGPPTRAIHPTPPL